MGPKMGLTNREEAILKSLEGANDEDVISRIAKVLCAQERKIEELTSKLHALKIYEKHRDALLNGEVRADDDAT